MDCIAKYFWKRSAHPMTFKKINIVADENILGLDQYFKNSTEVSFAIKKLPGRSIKDTDLKQCDVLLVRSVTPVNEALLHATRVRFVGTATSGVEHIDTQYLENRNIHFCDAKGANANAVAEFIIASIAYLCLQDKKNYFEKKIAIVGHGHVGKALEKKLNAFASKVNIYDPFLKQDLISESKTIFYCDWQDVLSSDLISLHVPYTGLGKFPTKNLLNKAFFDAIGNDSILLNAARGEICEEDSLLEKLATSDLKIVWDVWNHEPDISKALLSKATLASPHIAGYSLDAKLNATEVLARKVHDILNLDFNIQAQDEIEKFYLKFDNSVTDIFHICHIILLAYNPVVDSENLRGFTKMSLSEHFDNLRRNYRHRYEWKHFNASKLKVAGKYKVLLKTLGFYFEE